jgi:DNA-binding GntR family transcriptional regulator
MLTNKEIPQHRQLYEILKGHIQKGIYKEGDLLPSENALCQTYSLTRPTVRQALNTLKEEGLIKKQRGKGSIVQKKKSGIGILSIVGTTDSVTNGTLTTKVIESPKIGPWNQELEFDLIPEEVQSGRIRLERLRLLDGEPVLYEITYLPNINLPRFCNRSYENKSLFETLYKYYNIKITGGEQKIWALQAQGIVCNYLGVKEGTPILHLQKKFETSRPYFHFYASLWCNTDEFYLQGQF